MAPVAIHQTAFTSSKFQPPFKSHSDTSTVHKPMRDSSPVHRARGDSSPVHKPKKDSSLFQHGRPPPVAVSAHGLIIHLEDGRDVLDGCGGAAVACLGSGNREIIDAMCSQANTLSFAYHQVVGNPAAEELAAWLCDRSEGAFVGAAFLNSGETGAMSWLLGHPLSLPRLITWD